jgi:hypothetical protein
VGPGDPGAPAAADPDPLPGQGRATVERVAGLPGGGFRGRVINWSTGDGVGAAELTFSAAGGDVITVRSDERGSFDLAPPRPGAYTLATVEAAGFLPYAPEWQHSTVRLTSRGGERVRGLTVFLFPAVDYVGLVVDAADHPVAGATVRLLGSPTGEQALAGPPTAWVSGADGRFVFHAPDDAVLEAEAGGQRARARLDGDVAITHSMVLKLGALPAADATIAGRVTGDDGTGLAGVLVRAVPILLPGERTPGMKDVPDLRAVAFTMSGDDGRFVLHGIDGGHYAVSAAAEDRAPVTETPVPAGTRDLRLVLGAGQTLSGKVVTSSGEPIPAFTLLVFRSEGVLRALVTARSVVDGGGRFAVQVPAGEYQLLATAAGWAPSPFTPARPDEAVTLTLPGGASVRGRVVSGAAQTPVPYARIMREAAGGGASATPANAGTVTRADGTFELTGIPPGPLSLTIAAGGHHPKIEAGLVATDGAILGPLTIALTPLAAGETPTLELVGIGVKLAAESDFLRVEGVVPGGGAEAAGIVAGDRITAVEGTPVADIGLDGAISRIRGTPGTRVRITLTRDTGPLELEIERRAIRS